MRQLNTYIYGEAGAPELFRYFVHQIHQRRMRRVEPLPQYLQLARRRQFDETDSFVVALRITSSQIQRGSFSRHGCVKMRVSKSSPATDQSSSYNCGACELKLLFAGSSRTI